VTCELSRVLLVETIQHNKQHMQFTRRREKLVKSRKSALGAFRKRSVEEVYRDLLRGREGNYTSRMQRVKTCKMEQERYQQQTGNPGSEQTRQRLTCRVRLLPPQPR
jgi:hypothetical protein